VQRAVTTIGRLWRGELALGDAFWNWAVFGGVIVNLSGTFAFLVLLMAGHSTAGFIVSHAVSVPYNLLVLIGVWRAAGRYTGRPVWAGLARTVTAIGAVVLSVV